MLSEGKWLVVGLGNPGGRYENTRHNLGFMAVDLLAEELGVVVRREECKALIGQGRLDGATVELVKPQTFMNLSGESLACFLKKPDRSLEGVIVLTDDLAIPLGSIRIRPRGSDGGHNGLKSIIACVGTQDFKRIRIGIQPDHPVGDTSRFVLERLGAADMPKVKESLRSAADAVKSVIREGVEKAMAEFN